MLQLQLWLLCGFGDFENINVAAPITRNLKPWWLHQLHFSSIFCNINDHDYFVFKTLPTIVERMILWNSLCIFLLMKANLIRDYVFFPFPSSDCWADDCCLGFILGVSLIQIRSWFLSGLFLWLFRFYPRSVVASNQILILSGLFLLKLIFRFGLKCVRRKHEGFDFVFCHWWLHCC